MVERLVLTLLFLSMNFYGELEGYRYICWQLPCWMRCKSVVHVCSTLPCWNRCGSSPR
ncbi:unnamed protein product, partial [Adineta ricciae]